MTELQVNRPEERAKDTRIHTVMYTMNSELIKDILSFSQNSAGIHGRSMIIDLDDEGFEPAITASSGQHVPCRFIFYDDPLCDGSPRQAVSFQSLLSKVFKGEVKEIILLQRDAPAVRLCLLVGKLLKEWKLHPRFI